jgi:hypothetical protein
MAMRILMAAAGLLALAACGGPADNGNQGTAEKTSPPSGGTGLQLQPGQWETTTEFVKVEGVPKQIAAAMGAAQKETSLTCITPEEVKQANSGLFSGDEQKNCKKEGFAFQNGRITGKLSCTGEQGQGSTSVEVDGQYSASTYEVNQKLSTNVQGMTMTMVSRIKGRRIGECPAGENQEG